MRSNGNQIAELLPEDAVRAAFMRGVEGLPEAERERLYTEHQKRVRRFLGFLKDAECYVAAGRPARDRESET